MNSLIDKFLKTIPSVTTDPWQASKFRDWQKQTNKLKGNTGENYIKFVLETEGFSIDSVGGSEDHDLIDTNTGLKIEVKTSFAAKVSGKPLINSDGFIFQHIGLHKDWDWLAFVGINHENPAYRHVRRGWREETEDVVVRFVSREKFEEWVREGLFKPQQGGESGGNDDWWSTSTFFKDTNYLADYTKYLPAS